jgi:tRNA(Ile)-lysidine synthase
VGRSILAAWRRLTGGRATPDADRRTLVALSGGADSTALLLALSCRPKSIVAAHILHDMRPESETQVDRLACQKLCQKLGLLFVSKSIVARSAGGNLEAAARRERYRALAELATEAGCRFVATGHHADDQLETLLMRLLRGSGVRGMAGVRERRRLADSVTLVRPMLGVHRADAERLCTDLGVGWRTDATNADVALLRTRLRLEIVPSLLAIAPHAARHAASLARACADAGAVLAAAADAALQRAHAGEQVWSRAILRAEPGAVLREAVAEMIRSRGGGVRRREVSSVVRAIRSDGRSEKEFSFEGCVVRVSAETVRVEEPST